MRDEPLSEFGQRRAWALRARGAEAVDAKTTRWTTVRYYGAAALAWFQFAAGITLLISIVVLFATPFINYTWPAAVADVLFNLGLLLGARWARYRIHPEVLP